MFKKNPSNFVLGIEKIRVPLVQNIAFSLILPPEIDNQLVGMLFWG